MFYLYYIYDIINQKKFNHFMDATATKILSEHTPKHLQSQVAGIASMDKFINAVCIPTKILIERNVLNTNWNSRELPTTIIVLNK